MELNEAVEIVKGLEGETYLSILKRKDDIDYPEAIRTVCAAKQDEVDSKILKYIPSEMSVYGLYPTVITTFPIKPDNVKVVNAGLYGKFGTDENTHKN